jgi:hypothetical protein
VEPESYLLLTERHFFAALVVCRRSTTSRAPVLSALLAASMGMVFVALTGAVAAAAACSFSANTDASGNTQCVVYT